MDYDFRERTSRLYQLPLDDDSHGRLFPHGTWLGPALAFAFVFWGGVAYWWFAS